MSMLYTELDSTREIRLLRLYSRSSLSEASSVQVEENVPIRCHLYPIAFHEAKNQGYEALSYTWGAPEEPLSILVNETEVLVTRNLHVALEHLRGETTEVVLWVDALCINQKDSLEKSAQLNMMTEIYTHAKSTRVWLGPADETSDEIMVKLAQIGKTVIDRGAADHFIRMTTLHIRDPASAGQAENQATSLIEDLLHESLVQLEDSLRLLSGFRKLLSRPYWSRVWILQEIVVSRNVEVYCGKMQTGFAVLYAAMLYIIYMRSFLATQLVEPLTALLEASDGDFPPDCELKAQFDSVNSIEVPPSASLVSGMRLRYHDPAQENGETRFNLIQLLARIRVGREAGDPRDRIFALLGMAADAEALRIIPNYADTNSCADVYCNATRAMIASGHVDILAFSQWIKTDPDVPSWVPDWRKEAKEPFGQLPWDTAYSASGSTTFASHLGQTLSISHLEMNGFLVDSIESLKPQCNNGEWLGFQHRHEACTYLQDIMALCQISNEKLVQSGVEIYHDPSVRERAYQRVPVADLYSTGLVRRATIDECHLGHTEVITDYIQRKKNGPSAGAPLTNTFKSYYTMMGQQVERKPFVTVKGFVGLAPKHVKEGDIIVVFPGARFPYVLRRCDDGMYLLVGETFVHGIMYGEFVTEQREMEEFVLK
jgi:hypothetical protein